MSAPDADAAWGQGQLVGQEATGADGQAGAGAGGLHGQALGMTSGAGDVCR